MAPLKVRDFCGEIVLRVWRIREGIHDRSGCMPAFLTRGTKNENIKADVIKIYGAYTQPEHLGPWRSTEKTNIIWMHPSQVASTAFASSASLHWWHRGVMLLLCTCCWELCASRIRFLVVVAVAAACVACLRSVTKRCIRNALFDHGISCVWGGQGSSCPLCFVIFASPDVTLQQDTANASHPPAGDSLIARSAVSHKWYQLASFWGRHRQRNKL